MKCRATMPRSPRDGRPGGGWRWLHLIGVGLLVLLTGAAGCAKDTSSATSTGAPPSTTQAPAATSSGGAGSGSGSGTGSNDSGSGDSGSADTPPSTATKAPGPPAKGSGAIMLVTLGDSLTAGQGEEPERGYPERLKDWLEANGHPGSTVQNLGRSGWTSQQVIDGADGERGQVPAAEELIGPAVSEGTPVIATLLIGSNDLWYLYNNDGTTTADEERADLEHYRGNLQKTVRALKAAGATVVLGINDDQSYRPLMTDPTMRENTFPSISPGEVAQMSAQAKKYATVVREVAADNSVPVVDFLEAPLFRDPARLNEDGGHPNTRGYDEMTEIWERGMQPLI